MHKSVQRLKKRWGKINQDICSEYDAYLTCVVLLEKKKEDPQAVVRFESCIYNLRKLVSFLANEVRKAHDGIGKDEKSMNVVNRYSKELKVKQKMVDSLYYCEFIPNDVRYTYKLILQTEGYLNS